MDAGMAPAALRSVMHASVVVTAQRVNSQRHTRLMLALNASLRWAWRCDGDLSKCTRGGQTPTPTTV